MKALKIFLITIAVVLALLIAAVLILPQMIDPNDYKDKITQTIKDRTGLALTIKGDLSLSVFPWLGIQTGALSLAQPKQIGTGNMAEIAEANIQVKLLPLLQKKIHIDTVLLKQPKIQLITNAQGLNSVDILLNNINSSKAPEKNNALPNNNTSSSQTENTGRAIAALTIAGVNITDGEISIKNHQQDSTQHISQLNINSGDILNNPQALLSISGVLNKTNERIKFSINTQTNLDTEALTLLLKKIKFSVSQTYTQKDKPKDNTLNGTIDFFEFNTRKNTSNIRSIKASALFDRIPGQISIPEINANIQEGSASIPKIMATIFDTTISSNLTIKNKHEIFILQGSVSSNTFNLKQLLKSLAIDHQPTKPSSLEKLSFKTDFNGTQNGLALKKITVKIDDSTLQGNISLVNFIKPQYHFDLSLDTLNVDNYLSKNSASNTSKKKITKNNITFTQTMAAPIGLLQTIHANGVFRAKKLSASGIKLNDVYVDVASTDKKLTIKPKATLYDGTFNGTVSTHKLSKEELLAKGSSAQNSDAVLSVISTLNNINLQPLLIDADITDKLSGIGNITTNITIKTEGIKNNASKPTAKGTITLSAKNGLIKGINIKKVLDDAQDEIDKIRGKSVTESTDEIEDETRFSNMSATLLLNDHIIKNNDLSIKAPVFRIGGNGTIDIEKQTLDYLSSIVIVNTNSGQGGENIEDLKGLTIPVRFFGPLTEPKYKIDGRALLKANTSKSIEKKKQKLKDKLLKKWGLNEQSPPKDTGASSSEGNEKAIDTQPIEEEKSAKEKLKDDLKRKFLEKLF